MKELLNLFLTFARIGALTFGGGYAMLPILQRELVDQRKWVTEEELMDYFAIGQTTPGVIAVNTATFIGQKRKGTLGGAIATLGVVFPSIVIISIVAMFINNFADSVILQNAFAGIRVSVYVLILNAVLKLWKSAIVDKIGIIIFIAIFSLSIFTNLSPILFIVGAGLAGFIAKRQQGVVS
ncbi:chromate transporter [Amphibacillus marinus]|uniref:Chromate transporter n=1 Tax=Amphibacillus marinus TaxID=872970 RepID=A0A1H8GQC6_9BACI|nr:chromate transporter [Amphibacillus marinus]SEN46203.1 chromate transporter [Amphibacillus marinus]